MDLTNYLNLSQFICPLGGEHIAEAYNELLDVMKNKKLLKKRKEIIDQMLQAEEAAFDIAPGVSIPHLRIKNIDDILLSVGLSPKGIVKTGGRQKIHLFFFELIPPKDSEKHIYLLSETAKLIESISVQKLISEVMTSSQLYSKLTAAYESIGDR